MNGRQVAMLWHGGYSYSWSDASSTEFFPSMSAATAEFRRRYSGRDPFYPGVDSSCTAWVYVDSGPESCQCDGTDHGGQCFEGAYPDYVLTIGPRGGTVRERV